MRVDSTNISLDYLRKIFIGKRINSSKQKLILRINLKITAFVFRTPLNKRSDFMISQSNTLKQYVEKGGNGQLQRSVPPI